MKKLLALAIAAAAAIPAHANLTASDSAFGANTHIYDDRTGLTWLRLDVTHGMSYNDVAGQTAAGGSFAGYRTVETREVWDLFANIADPSTPMGEAWIGNNGGSNDPGIWHRALSFIGLMSGSLQLTEPVPGTFSAGVIGRAGCQWMFNGSCSHYNFIGPSISTSASNPFYSLRMDGYLTPDDSLTYSNFISGTYLVAAPVAAPVPEPGTYALLAMGLVGVVGGARRRRATA